MMRTHPSAKTRYVARTATLWALAGLSLGVAVYALARDHPTAWLPVGLGWAAGAGWAAASPITGSLPALCHAFAFTLLGALALGFTRRALWWSAAVWVGIGSAFEMLQHPWVANALLPLPGEHATPGLLAPVTGLLAGYAHLGTFDVLDLIAVAVGGALACWLGHRWLASARAAS